MKIANVEYEASRVYQTLNAKRTEGFIRAQKKEQTKLYIPEKKDIIFPNVTEMYYNKDPDKKRKLYFCYGNVRGDEDKIQFAGDTKATMFYCDDSRIRQFESTNLYPHVLDPNKFSLVNNQTIEGGKKRNYCVFPTPSISLFATFVKNSNEKVIGIKGGEEQEENGMKYINIMNGRIVNDENDLYYHTAGFNIERGNEYITTIKNTTEGGTLSPPVYYNDIYLNRVVNGASRLTIKNDKLGKKFELGMPYFFNGQSLSHNGNVGMNSEFRFLDWSNNDRVRSFAAVMFFVDENNDVWIMINYANMKGEKLDPKFVYNFTSCYTRVKDLPKGPFPYVGWFPLKDKGVIGFSGNYSFMTDEEAQEVNDMFLRLLNMKDAGGGPDIVGPGNDPYDKNTNIDGVIGGDVNIDKDITPDEELPNGTDGGLRSSGLSGAYILTPNNIKNYTLTIETLLEGKDVPAIDKSELEAAGKRMEQNTISLNLLPIAKEKFNVVSGVDFVVGGQPVYVDGVAISPTNDKADLIAGSILKFETELPVIYNNYDNFLDFAPYSTITLKSPATGTHQLPANLIQTPKNSKDIKQLKLSTRIDIMTGDVVEVFFINGCGYCEWTGNIAKSVALSVTDVRGELRSQTASLMSVGSIIGGIGLAAATVATGGTAGVALGGVAAAAGGAASLASPSNINTASILVGAANRNGGVNWLSSQDYILTVERPVRWGPYDYANTIGYPTKKNGVIGSIKGFARISNVHLKCSATNSEKAKITEILANGIRVKEGEMPKPSGSNTEVILYKCRSSENIDTVKELEDPLVQIGTFKENGVSIENPIFSFSGTNAKDYNYAYIPKFNRYYFIADTEMLYGKRTMLKLEEDYLSSHWAEIQKNDGYVDTSENYGNFYLQDVNLPVQQNTEVFTRKVVPSPFSDRQSSVIMNAMRITKKA